MIGRILDQPEAAEDYHVQRRRMRAARRVTRPSSTTPHSQRATSLTAFRGRGPGLSLG